MKVYLAGRYARQAELCDYREELRAVGIEVTSRWLDGPEQRRLNDGYRLGLREERLVERLEGDEGVELAGMCAVADVVDVHDCDVMVSFTGGDPGSGGRHVEWGIAVAWEKELMIVGPREHVFHCTSDVLVFDDWEECRHHLTRWQRLSGHYARSQA